MRSQSKLTIGTTEKLLGWDLKVVLKLNYAKKSSQIMLFNFKTYPSTIEVHTKRFVYFFGKMANNQSSKNLVKCLSLKTKHFIGLFVI